jgi:hypothetical protein
MHHNKLALWRCKVQQTVLDLVLLHAHLPDFPSQMGDVRFPYGGPVLFRQIENPSEPCLDLRALLP